MEYFPISLKIEDKNILIIGGGKIANNKLSNLLDFTTNIKIVAKDINSDIYEKIKQYNLKYEIREYKQSDLKNIQMIIIAIDNIKLQKIIYNQAKELGILVNSVDDIQYCDFIFPSYIKKHNLLIAISTNGTAPALSKELKRFFIKLIPKDIEEFLNQMKFYRQTMPKGKNRMEFLQKRAKEYIDKSLTRYNRNKI